MLVSQAIPLPAYKAAAARPATRLAGKVGSEVAKALAEGAVVETAIGLGKGEVAERLKRELPMWALGGAAGPLLGAGWRAVRGKPIAPPRVLKIADNPQLMKMLRDARTPPPPGQLIVDFETMKGKVFEGPVSKELAERTFKDYIERVKILSQEEYGRLPGRQRRTRGFYKYSDKALVQQIRILIGDYKELSKVPPKLQAQIMPLIKKLKGKKGELVVKTHPTREHTIWHEIGHAFTYEEVPEFLYSLPEIQPDPRSFYRTNPVVEDLVDFFADYMLHGGKLPYTYVTKQYPHLTPTITKQFEYLVRQKIALKEAADAAAWIPSTLDEHLVKELTPAGRINQRLVSTLELSELDPRRVLEVTPSRKLVLEVPPEFKEAFTEMIEPELLKPKAAKGFRLLDKIRPTAFWKGLSPETDTLQDVIATGAGHWNELRFEADEMSKGIQKLVKKLKAENKLDDVKKVLVRNDRLGLNQLKDPLFAELSGDQQELVRLIRQATDQSLVYNKNKILLSSGIESGRFVGPEDVRVPPPPANTQSIVNQIDNAMKTNPGYLPHRREGKWILHVTNELGEATFTKHSDKIEDLRKTFRMMGGKGKAPIFARKTHLARHGPSRGDLTRLDDILMKEGIDPMAPPEEWAEVVSRLREQAAKGDQQFLWVSRTDVPGWDDSVEGIAAEVIDKLNRAGRSYANTWTGFYGGKVLPTVKQELRAQATELLGAVTHPDINSLSIFPRTLRLLHLGFRPAYGVRNVQQTITHGLPKIMEEVGPVEGMKIRLQSYADAAGFFARKGVPKTHLKLWDKFVRRGDLYIGQSSIYHGLDEASQVWGRGFGPRGPKIQKVEDAASIFVRLSDGWNRACDLAAALRIGDKKGLKGEQLYKYARDFVHQTQVAYGGWNKPILFAKSGEATPLVRLATMYTTYLNNTLYTMAKRMKGNWSGRFGQILGLGLVGGLYGIPGTVLMRRLLASQGVDLDAKAKNFFKKILSLPEALGLQMESGLEMLGISKKQLEKAKEIGADIMLGGPAYAAGLESPGWLGLGAIPFGYPRADLLGPVKGTKEDVGRMVESIREGDIQGAAEISPLLALRGPAKALRWASEGELRSRHGMLLRDEKGNPIDVNALDVFYTFLGLPVKKERRGYQRQAAVKGIVEGYRRKYRTYLKLLARAVVRGDRPGLQAVWTSIREHNRNNPETPIVITPPILQDAVRRMQGLDVGRVPLAIRGEVEAIRRQQ